MAEQGTYLKELAVTMLKYRRDKFLCDLVVVATEEHEVYAHSVVLAAASSKLRAAFEQQRASRKNNLFRSYVWTVQFYF